MGLSDRVQRFMLFYLRAVVFLFAGTVVLILGALLGLCMPFHPWAAHVVTRSFCHLGAKIFGIELQVSHYQKLVANTPCIIISNHQHTLDILLSGMIMPKRTVTLGKTALFFIPFFGFCFWIFGHIPINRSNRKKSLKSMERIDTAILKHKKSIWIMPEGTRSQGQEILLPFKKGAFITAKNTAAPIVPICIVPYVGHINWNRPNSVTITAEVLDPIRVGTRPIREVMEETRQRMRDKIDELLRKQYAPLVAIDGPGGSGKSTVAKKLAQHLRVLYIDTGAMYRALACAAQERGVVFEEGTALENFLQGIEFKYADGDRLVSVDGEDLTEKIRDHHIAELASVFSALPSVRNYLTALQKTLPSQRFCVMEGRDIGTVVFPHALCKFFLTASAGERAKRRRRQLRESGDDSSSLESILADQKIRDKRDQERDNAPLRKAPDAELVNTDGKTVDEVVALLSRRVRERMKRTSIGTRT